MISGSCTRSSTRRIIGGSISNRFGTDGGRSEPVDIGEIAKSGAKSIWRRMRSASSASSWNSPSPSPYGSSWSSPAPLASPRRIPGERRGSVPNLSSRPPTPLAEPSLDTVKEEDKLSGLHITTSSPPPDDSRRSSESFNAWSWKGGHGAGEATPRRFPSPPPRNTVLPEDDEEVEERQEAVQAISPPRSPIRYTPAEGPVAPVPSRRRQAAVLGFDEARYGR